jgi:hypothetical protein
LGLILALALSLLLLVLADFELLPTTTSEVFGDDGFAVTVTVDGAAAADPEPVPAPPNDFNPRAALMRAEADEEAVAGAEAVEAGEDIEGFVGGLLICLVG